MRIIYKLGRLSRSPINPIKRLYHKMEQEPHHITEGLAKIQTCGKVFYNPVQEFNRDLR